MPNPWSKYCQRVPVGNINKRVSTQLPIKTCAALAVFWKAAMWGFLSTPVGAYSIPSPLCDGMYLEEISMCQQSSSGRFLSCCAGVCSAWGRNPEKGKRPIRALNRWQSCENITRLEKVIHSVEEISRSPTWSRGAHPFMYRTIFLRMT